MPFRAPLLFLMNNRLVNAQPLPVACPANILLGQRLTSHRVLSTKLGESKSAPQKRQPSQNYQINLQQHPCDPVGSAVISQACS